MGDFVSENFTYILVGMGLIFLFWNILLEIRLYQQKKRISFFFKGKEAKDLEEVISEILKKVRNNENEIKEILKKISQLDEVALRAVQKIGIIRFNPFKDTGGNQSFSLAILDQKDDGVVISSYHSKDGTRVYAKPIRNGESNFPLSKEEELAIKQAIEKNEFKR